LSPSNPTDPRQGEPRDVEQTETAADEATGAVGQDAAEVESQASADAESVETDAGTDSEAVGTAAAETGIDKTAAQTLKPSTSSRRRDSRGSVDPDLVVRAQAKYVRTSARKARMVCDQIRGKDVAEAQAILAFTPRAVAKPWAKLLTSAIANAEHNHELVSDDLRILAVYADEGPTIKRFRPRAMGRATSIRKRTSHLTIALGPKTGPNRKGGR
jgi:ribosomal protein L22